MVHKCFAYTIWFSIFIILNTSLYSQEKPHKPGFSITRIDNNDKFYDIRVSINDSVIGLLKPNQIFTRDLPSGQHKVSVYKTRGGGVMGTSATFIVNNNFHIFTIYVDTDCILGNTGILTLQSGSDDKAIQNSFRTLSQNIHKGAKIAIINIDSNDDGEGIFFIEEITIAFVNSKNYVVVDRRTLDAILTEQEFQMTGYVDDDSIVSIGHFIGADVVLTGSISGTGERKRLRLKAVDVRTAQILAMSSESI